MIESSFYAQHSSHTHVSCSFKLNIAYGLHPSIISHPKNPPRQDRASISTTNAGGRSSSCPHPVDVQSHRRVWSASTSHPNTHCAVEQRTTTAAGYDDERLLKHQVFISILIFIPSTTKKKGPIGSETPDRGPEVVAKQGLARKRRRRFRCGSKGRRARGNK